MTWNGYHRIYLAGIGGIGMSALARYFHSLELEVAGYDRTPTELTQELENAGMVITYADEKDTIPSRFMDAQGTLVIYTPALPSNHAQMAFFRSAGHNVLKRSEVLGMITKGHFTIAVAGTHGKTTTSSLIAHLLKASGRSFTAFLGGIATNFNSNYVHFKGRGEHVIVVEADEYDRSFLRLFPNVAVVTSADADHLDIYGTEDELKDGFRKFIENIDKDGTLVIHDKVMSLADRARCNVLTYSINRGQFFADNISINDGFFTFDLYAKNSIYRSLTSGAPGFYNIENGIAALAVMQTLGESLSDVAIHLSTFLGVKRRFETVLRREGLVVIDDYAHHPAEISAFLGSVRELYPNRKLTVVFQPHLFTRTRDLADGFAESLSMADSLLLLDIYPARELPIEGVTSDILLSRVKVADKKVVSKKYILEEYSPADNEVFTLIGAGDIDQLAGPLTKKWNYGKA